MYKSFQRATVLWLLCALNVPLISARAQGTAFTYQGRLDDGANPATGLYDLRFMLYDASINGNQAGNSITNAATGVTNGLFTVTLDFGGVFSGTNYWLDIGVRTNGASGFATLTPRQPVAPAPYAIMAASASNLLGSLPAAQLSGTVALAQLPGAVVTNNETSVNISGTFSGNGAGLTNLNASQLKSGVVPTSVLAGFQSPYQTVGGGLATTAGGSYATVGGGWGNSASGAGATVAGGGFDGVTLAGNIASGGGAAVSGGNANAAKGLLSVVGGGNNNQATNSFSTVPGGQFNLAGGQHSFAAGRKAQATNDGAFVWADTTDAYFSSTNNNSFNVRANGGARFVTGGAGMTIDGQPLMSSASTVSLAQLPSAVVTNNSTGVTLSGVFTGKGGGLTGLSASNLTGVVSDYQLSTNVAMLRVPGAFTFTPVQKYGGGEFVTAIDLNNDSNLDLIAVDSGGTVSTLINNGNGGFALTATASAGPGADSIAVADIYGDGKSSVVSANSGNGTLSVLTNNGGGSFTLAGSVTVGGSPFSVIAADVNGDGKPDLVSANNNNTLTVLTNDGKGTFILEQAPNVGSPAIFVAAADVNGDHKIDLICARQLDYLVVLTNNGSGLFTLAQTLPAVTGYPVAAVAADVNGDGKVDIITADGGGSTLSVLTNDGSGLFALAQSAPEGGNVRSVTAADVNGDGYVDLVGANYDQNTLSVLTNNGRGLFTFAQTANPGSTPHCVLANDVNRDGRMDLISANSDGSVSVLLGTTVPNVPLFNANQTFTGANVFTNVGNMFAGDGSGLTGLNASQLTSGTIPSARLSGTYLGALTFNNAGNSFTGNGAGLTALNASQLSSGTLADSRLSANVPLLNANQTFTGRNSFNQGVGVGTTSSLEGDVTINTNTYLFSHAIYLRGETGSDHNHGLAYNGQTITNFGTGNVQVDGPVLWGFSGGALGVVSGGAHAVLTWTNGGASVTGGFAFSSDRNMKSGFAALDAQDVLARVVALPMSSWYYKTDTGARHIGPMAQDFHAAFQVNGSDDTHINIGDEAGAALAAIQALNQKLNEKDAKIQSLEKKMDELQAMVKQLEAHK